MIIIYEAFILPYFIDLQKLCILVFSPFQRKIVKTKSYRAPLQLHGSVNI